jgi:hypothetical protein
MDASAVERIELGERRVTSAIACRREPKLQPSAFIEPRADRDIPGASRFGGVRCCPLGHRPLARGMLGASCPIDLPPHVRRRDLG